MYRKPIFQNGRLFLCVFIVMTILIVAPVMAATTGIIVSSIPSGASIYLDPSNSNDGYKGTTPQLISGLTTGSHYFRLTLEGYADATQSVNLSSNSLTWVTITMPSTPSTTGSIDVRSVPSGANISLDGTYTGITPYTITGVPVGEHAVKLTKSGYFDVTLNITVSNGHTTSVIVPLPPPTGPIMVNSDPSGANIYLDGTYTGITPYTITGVPVGEHAVKLTKSGYFDVTQTVTVSYGQTASVDRRMSPHTGKIVVHSVPSGAIIYLDGKDQGYTTKVLIVPIGSHSVELKKWGEWGGFYVNVSKTVTVSSGSVEVVDLILQRPTA